jgi:hypothetical protein
MPSDVFHSRPGFAPLSRFSFRRGAGSSELWNDRVLYPCFPARALDENRSVDGFNFVMKLLICLPVPMAGAHDDEGNKFYRSSPQTTRGY